MNYEHQFASRIQIDQALETFLKKIKYYFRKKIRSWSYRLDQVMLVRTKQEIYLCYNRDKPPTLLSLEKNRNYFQYCSLKKRMNGKTETKEKNQKCAKYRISNTKFIRHFLSSAQIIFPLNFH